MRALHTASTGMMAQELNVQVISNNIANLRTTGYKRQRAQFQDLLYETFRRPGAATSEQGNLSPTGILVGSGVKTGAVSRIMTQGNITATEKDFDVAIRGDGFFAIQMPDGRTAYTRDGSFNLDNQGRLVTSDGYVVDGVNQIPQNAKSVSINAQGQVQANIQGQTDAQDLGQLRLVRFVNKGGLESIGDNLYLETAASGTALDTEGSASVQQGYLEEANVNAVSEISALIAAQRAYEMNSKVVSAADQMLSATSQMFRG